MTRINYLNNFSKKFYGFASLVLFIIMAFVAFMCFFLQEYTLGFRSWLIDFLYIGFVLFVLNLLDFFLKCNFTEETKKFIKVCSMALISSFLYFMNVYVSGSYNPFIMYAGSEKIKAVTFIFFIFISIVFVVDYLIELFKGHFFNDNKDKTGTGQSDKTDKAEDIMRKLIK